MRSPLPLGLFFSLQSRQLFCRRNSSRFSLGLCCRVRPCSLGLCCRVRPCSLGLGGLSRQPQLQILVQGFAPSFLLDATKPSCDVRVAQDILWREMRTCACRDFMAASLRVACTIRPTSASTWP